MLDFICELIARIVFTGINGLALIPLLAFLLWLTVGQAKEIRQEIKKVWGVE